MYGTAGTLMDAPHFLHNCWTLAFFTDHLGDTLQSPLGPLKACFISFPHHPERLGSHHYPQVKYGDTEAQRGWGLPKGT